MNLVESLRFFFCVGLSGNAEAEAVADAACVDGVADCASCFTGTGTGALECTVAAPLE